MTHSCITAPKRCFFIWIVIWTHFPAYTVETSGCVCFLQRFLKSKKMSIFLINLASLTMNRRGDRSGSPRFVLILECESFTFLSKKYLKKKKRIKQADPVHCCLLQRNMFFSVWLEHCNIKLLYYYESQDLNNLSNPRTECSTFAVFLGAMD